MRGKVTLQDVPCDSVGITPAYAGKSKRRALPALSPGDHPRMCGEKDYTVYRTPDTPGSPPHVRGKAKGDELGLSQTRITPACAGKRSRRTGRRWSSRDHPRVCGEKRFCASASVLGMGSPPRMRGKDTTFSDATQWLRITPAYAGKSSE